MSKTATTETSHEPSPDEVSHATEDQGLHHPGDVVGEAHGADDHGEDDHANEADALGPVDVQAWGALVLGVAAGLLIVLCLVLTTTVLA